MSASALPASTLPVPNVKLFLIEILLEHVEFAGDYSPLPKLENLKFQVNLEDVFSFNIDVSSFQNANFTRENFNIGKSYLFPYNIERKLSSTVKTKLEIKFFDNDNELGVLKVPLTTDLPEIFKLLNGEESKQPATLSQTYFVMKDTEIARVDLFMRFTNCGDFLQSQFFMERSDDREKRMIIENEKDAVVQQRTLDSAGPVSPIITTDPQRKEQLATPPSRETNVASWTALFDTSLTPKLSFVPPQFTKAMQSGSTVSILTHILATENKNFLNLQELWHIQSQVDKRATKMKAPLTAETINHVICNNKYCPAAQKFKRYGLGPLANEKERKDLGCITGDVDPPVTYALSQTYGTFERYGPYGLFSRPKKLTEPFIPKTPAPRDINNCIECSERTDFKCGAKKRKTCSHMQQLLRENFDDPLFRLRGGSNENVLRLKGGGAPDDNSPKSPFQECKSVMDQFDKILAEYRQAIGPCGQGVCPFAANNAAHSCNQSCKSKPTTSKGTSATQPGIIDIKDVPIDQKLAALKVNMVQPGCGNPKCSYSKYKAGLMDDDAAIELAYLPPAAAAKCSPKCAHPFSAPLPPIHWDCPDPLPKGACRNPNCPYLPPDIKAAKALEKKGPCGSPNCPYVLPKPCDKPTCPFNEDGCPFKHKNANDCDNPDCPFSNREEDPLKNKKAPDNEAIDICGNPLCPFGKPSSFVGNDAVCADPDCPFLNQKICFPSVSNNETEKPCDNTECPFQLANKLPGNDKNCEQQLCDNPDCPFNTSSKANMPNKDQSTCNLPNCPFNTAPSSVKSKSYCGTPGCPFGEPYADQVSQLPTSTTNTTFTTCGNPDCPIKHEGDIKFPQPSTEATCVKEVVAQQWPSDSQKDIESDGKGSRKRKRRNKKKQEQIVEINEVAMSGGHCACSGKHRKRKRHGPYVYSLGDKYPGMKIGHRECVVPLFKVPAKMGWLWNLYTPYLGMKPRRGWRPGAIGHTIARMIREHHINKGIPMLKLPHFQNKLEQGSQSDVTVSPKPTLQIKKKDGVYLITMNPLKDPKTLAQNENPYMECTPMQFRISKKPKPKPQRLCFCDGDDNETMAALLAKSEVQDGSLSKSSSDSELDIEFTPPAGIIHPERYKKQPHVVHADVQYDPEDFKPPGAEKKKKEKGGEKKAKGKKKDKKSDKSSKSSGKKGGKKSADKKKKGGKKK